ncbi:MAG TPA: 50S ribosomal protein L18 [Candidatus Saccharimonadales bacterium]|jgi:large subunit ribosomal protein L18|nr:50S ribosomal protein L18 [Candidatus Saccharimonadales bacterium]
MNKLAKKLLNRALRKGRVRARISGSAARPRLSVFISNTHVSVQLIDDEKSQTLASTTSVGAKIDGTMTDKAAWAGSDIAKKAKKAKVSQVVFDRNGRRYAGRLKALADAARKEGLEF